MIERAALAPTAVDERERGKEKGSEFHRMIWFDIVEAI